MKVASLFLFLLVLGVLFALGASAQALIDQTMGMAAGGSELSSMKAPPPPSMIMNALEHQGFTNISDLTPTPLGTPMHATAVSPAGIPVDLQIDPLSGKLVSATPR